MSHGLHRSDRCCLHCHVVAVAEGLVAYHLIEQEVKRGGKDPETTQKVIELLTGLSERDREFIASDSSGQKFTGHDYPFGDASGEFADRARKRKIAALIALEEASTNEFGAWR